MTGNSLRKPINVKFCVRGQRPQTNASAIIPWCNDYQKTLDSSKKALVRYLPINYNDWDWWLAVSDPDYGNSLADISPEAFAAQVDSDGVKLFLRGDPKNAELILYRDWPEPHADKYYSFNLSIIGESSAGKTTFLKHFSERKYVETSSTVKIEDIRTRRFTTRLATPVELFLRDTGNQERFNSLPPSMFRNVSGIFLVFDMTKTFSSDILKSWLDKVRDLVEDAPILLVGSKLDRKEKEFIPNEAIKFSQENNLLGPIITSGKVGSNIDAAFQVLLEAIFKQAEEYGDLSRYLKGPKVLSERINLDDRLLPPVDRGCQC